MLLARRASPRRAHHFPVGTEVIARPATVSRPLDGVVVELDNQYTLVVNTGTATIAVDVEDCEPMTRNSPVAPDVS
jgi:hypothetical protein